EVLPLIDDVHLPQAQRAGLVDADRSAPGPGLEPLRRQRELEARAVTRQRLLADAGAGAAPDLVAEAGTRAARLEAEHPQAELRLARDPDERSAGLLFAA